MLTDNEETLASPHILQPNVKTNTSDKGMSRLSRAMQVEWLGQMVASLCWIASVLSYGITANGDWLQMAAACSWLLANVASISSEKVH